VTRCVRRGYPSRAAPFNTHDSTLGETPNATRADTQRVSTPNRPRRFPRVRWYAVHRAAARVLIVGTFLAIVSLPRLVSAESAQPGSAILGLAGALALAAALAGAMLAMRDRRRGIRKQYAVSTAACLAAAIMAAAWFPRG
jgi:hypothetical protein